MRGRTIGKIVLAVITVLFVLLALNYTHQVGEDNLWEGTRAITFAILALTSATFYRYFED